MARLTMLIGEDIPEIRVKAGDIITINAATEPYKGKALAIGTMKDMRLKKAELKAAKIAAKKAEKEKKIKTEKLKSGGK